MPGISESEVRKHEVVVVPNYRSGMAFGTVSVAFHISTKEFHVLARLRRRQMPPRAPAHLAPMVQRNAGFMRQGTAQDSQALQILHRSGKFEDMVAWLNREFNLHLVAVK